MSLWARHLEILSRAVSHQNLTAASQHVGLSQPQLSRVIQQLELGLDVVLLDRGVRRRTNWTTVAYQLAELYERNNHQLEREMQSLLHKNWGPILKTACLEGLADLAVRHLGKLAKNPHWQVIQLDILDQTELEERFLNGGADAVWTSRVPGRGKPQHQLPLGFQTLDLKSKGTRHELMSRFEFGQTQRRAREREREPKKSDQLVVVSNSLRVREIWFATWGGRGLFPSEVQSAPARESVPVLLLGSHLLTEGVWSELKAAALKANVNSKEPGWQWPPKAVERPKSPT